MTRQYLLRLLIFHLCFFVCNSGTLPESQQAEQTLIDSLLNGYNKNIRPSSHVDIEINTNIKQIIAIDERQQIMTSSLIIAQGWNDDRLSWTSNGTNSNISVVMLPVKSIWIPDTMIFNSADTSGYLTISDYSLASVGSDGYVFLFLSALNIKTRCSFNARKFPFDKQVCSIDLTSWAQGNNRLTYSENKSLLIDLSDYTEHPLWRLDNVDTQVVQKNDRTPLENTYNDVISVKLFLSRKPLFFMVNGIFACLILNVVTLVAFPLPVVAQISLCMSCFLTYSVYALNFANIFPQQSEYLMTITVYFLLSIVWTLIAMIWFAFHHKFISEAMMPPVLFELSGLLQKLVKKFCEPKNAGDDKTTNSNQIHHHQVENSNLGDTQAIRINTVHSDEQNRNCKCNFCYRCQTCQTEHDDEKKNAQIKKDIEERCQTLNKFFLFLLFMMILISNLVVWLMMSQ